MATIIISLPESMQSFVEAKAVAEGHGDPSAYVRTLIAEAQMASMRAELDRKLAAGVDALDHGQGRELTTADWDTLKNTYR
jgi:hypothetical protein